MSMDNLVSPSAPKAAQTSGGHGAGKAQAATPGDFAALLLGLGAEELPLTDAAAPLLAETSEADPAALPLDPALLAAGLAPVTEPVAVAPGLVAEGPSAALKAAPTLPASAAERAELRTAQVFELRAETQTARPSDALAPPSSAAADGEVQPLLHQALLAQRMAQHRSQAAEAVQAARQTQGEALAARLGWQIIEPPASAPATLLAAAGELPAVSTLERRSERGGLRLGEANSWSGVPQAEGARLDVPAVAPDGGLTTEMRVAEQVSYWIGRGTQNAELEVEGLGEGPVKVSIELQGQEARVEFRADQAQTRQILQDAMPHLRELLEREGLVLSGLSVGTSGSEWGQGQGQGRDAEGRPGQRQGQPGGPELPAAALAAAHRAAPLAGRSVDLFV